MGQGKLIKHMAGKVSSTKEGSVEAKGSPGVKMSPLLGGMGRGLVRGTMSGKQDDSKGFAGEQQGKRRMGRGGLFGGATMRMAGSVGQKKEECD
tara:strand:+ start:152 stop:433 length:282 start_codon:yes stop_codon:yes gene_type:complete